MRKFFNQQELSEWQHQLSSLIGTWDYTVQYWNKEGASAQTSTGTMINEMILGSRFLSCKTGLLLNIGGQSIPYEGWGIHGYDATKKAFTFIWADTMLIGIMTGSGKYNESLKTMKKMDVLLILLRKKNKLSFRTSIY